MLQKNELELDSSKAEITPGFQHETVVDKPGRLKLAARALHTFWEAALVGGEVPPEGRDRSREEIEAMEWVRNRIIGL